MTADALSTTFSALADPTRRAILSRLAAGEASVNELARPFAMSLPAVSKHLKVLERAGLISRGRDAQWRPSRLQAEPLREAAGFIDSYRRFWEGSFDRLDAYLRDDGLTRRERRAFGPAPLGGLQKTKAGDRMMRRLVMLQHVSLDGYLGGPKGEMDWIKINDAIFEDVEPVTAAADTAVYGRVTYEMMAAYWPNAAEQPNAGAHDVSHARWVNAATKVVVSRTLKEAPWGRDGHAEVVRSDVPAMFAALKTRPGKNILLIGSPTLARDLIAAGLVDDYYLNINPVLLGAGLPLFPQGSSRRDLRLAACKQYDNGVLGCHFVAA